MLPAGATADEAHHYVYDAWNRLAEVWEDADEDGTLDDPGDTLVTTYRYDGLGRRVQKGASDVTYDYYYNTAWQVVEVRRYRAIQRHLVLSAVSHLFLAEFRQAHRGGENPGLTV